MDEKEPEVRAVGQCIMDELDFVQHFLYGPPRVTIPVGKSDDHFGFLCSKHSLGQKQTSCQYAALQSFF